MECEEGKPLKWSYSDKNYADICMNAIVVAKQQNVNQVDGIVTLATAIYVQLVDQHHN